MAPAVAGGVIAYEDLFEVIDQDPDGKKFDKVSRFRCRSQFEAELQIDINVDIYKLEVRSPFPSTRSRPPPAISPSRVGTARNPRTTRGALVVSRFSTRLPRVPFVVNPRAFFAPHPPPVREGRNEVHPRARPHAQLKRHPRGYVVRSERRGESGGRVRVRHVREGFQEGGHR